MNRTLSLFKHLLAVVAISTGAQAAERPKGTPPPFAKPTADARPGTVQTPANTKPELRGVNKNDLSTLKALNEKYRKAKSITMDVSKDVKIGLIGSERHSTGRLQLATGQIRMELEGSEHTMLIVNTKNIFAITYPDKALQGAAIQIIKGDVGSEKAKKKAPSSALANLLGPGGFLKSFRATGVEATGDVLTYFLSPIGESDMTRAQMKIENSQIRWLRYWDARENETTFTFSNVVFGTKIDPKTFNYTPPANADVMNL